jgi:hypothetical protein
MPMKQAETIDVARGTLYVVGSETLTSVQKDVGTG